jgi:hypothetical protein
VLGVKELEPFALTPNARAVLEGNRAAREGRVVTRHAPFAEHMCRIPLEHLPELNRLFPGFDGKSGTQAHDDAMRAFHASPRSALYDVRKRNPQTIKNRPRGIIIRPPRAQPGEDLAP